jgi:Na+/H+ antiporter NhaD/arsenite permease-like protein
VTIPAMVMILSAMGSYYLTPKAVHDANDFSFHPVKEVGYLFVGIFLTMIPALQILGSGEALNLTSPLQYYLASGSLSAFLDNAPTYLAFLAAQMGQQHLDVGSKADVLRFVTESPFQVMAVSLGAVFFGAGSYIGNGPNFMVKAIAGKAKVKTPTFLGYMFKFSIPILLPILTLVGWVILGGK